MHFTRKHKFVPLVSLVLFTLDASEQDNIIKDIYPWVLLFWIKIVLFFRVAPLWVMVISTKSNHYQITFSGASHLRGLGTMWYPGEVYRVSKTNERKRFRLQVCVVSVPEYPGCVFILSPNSNSSSSSSSTSFIVLPTLPPSHLSRISAESQSQQSSLPRILLLLFTGLLETNFWHLVAILSVANNSVWLWLVHDSLTPEPLQNASFFCWPFCYPIRHQKITTTLKTRANKMTM